MPTQIDVALSETAHGHGFKVKLNKIFKNEDLGASEDSFDIEFIDDADLEGAKIKIQKLDYTFHHDDDDDDDHHHDDDDDDESDGNFTLNFDLAHFDDSFEIEAKSEGPEDTFVVDGASSYEVEDGIYKITYTGADDEEHVVEIDPGVASVVVNLVCFTPSVRVRTPRGMVAVGTLQDGDLVMTKDHGPQPVMWVGKRVLNLPEGGHKFSPVLIGKDALGRGRPRHDVLVSPQHRILVQDPAKPEELAERLVPAKALTCLPGIRVAKGKNSVEYVSVLLPQHAILEAEGLPCESFLPRPFAMSHLTPAARQKVLDHFPDAMSNAFKEVYPPARPTLTVQQGRLLARRLRKSGRVAQTVSALERRVAAASVA